MDLKISEKKKIGMKSGRQTFASIQKSSEYDPLN